MGRPKIQENMKPTKIAVRDKRQLKNMREYESDKENNLREYGADKESSRTSKCEI